MFLIQSLKLVSMTKQNIKIRNKNFLPNMFLTNHINVKTQIKTYKKKSQINMVKEMSIQT